MPAERWTSKPRSVRRLARMSLLPNALTSTTTVGSTFARFTAPVGHRRVNDWIATLFRPENLDETAEALAAVDDDHESASIAIRLAQRVQPAEAAKTTNWWPGIDGRRRFVGGVDEDGGRRRVGRVRLEVRIGSLEVQPR